MTADILYLKLKGTCLIIAPLLFALSTFFWQNGEYGVTAGTMIILSNIFWIPALTALFGLLKNKMPWYSALGLFTAIYGVCIGGVAFGLLGYFATIFHVTHQVYIQTLAKYPFSSGILIFWAGPLFPLSLLILGIVFMRKKAIEPTLAVLVCLGAIAFPLSRIPRIELLAHLADVLLAIPFVVIGYRFISTPDLVLNKD